MLLKDLRYIRNYSFAYSGVDPESRQYLCGQGLLDDIELVNKDPDTAALLLCRVLDHLAVSPLRGDVSKPEPLFSGEGDEVFVNVQLAGVVNFVGAFMLSRSSLALSQLELAFSRNIKSSLFKAAQVQRRLASRCTRLLGQSQRRGSEAYRLAHEGALEAQGRPWNQLPRQAHEQIREAAEAARDACVEPRRAQILQRMQGISLKSMAPDVPKGYYDLLTYAALQWLRPLAEERRQSLQLA